MKIFRIICITVLLFVLQSCDPYVDVAYNIVNKTDDALYIQIFGLRNEYGEIIEKYDTALSVEGKINIYRYGSLGSGYTNPADTITVFDSIHVVKKNMKAKSDFTEFDAWDYTENKGKYGGGNFVYILRIKNDDF